MRKLAACVRVVVGALALGAACAAAGVAQASPPEFRTRLAPHGLWLDSPRYGRVWQPTVAKAGWNPYYDGHWEYTDLGQTWVSDYAWGSIPYHYGTWAVEPGRGWVWIPGDVWAPSWVVFRTGADYIGWAPVAPGFVVGAAPSWEPELDAGFVFVPSGRLFAPRVRACAMPASRTATIVSTTKILPKGLRVEDRFVANRGPSLEELRRATGQPVRIVRLESVKGMGPGVRREIQIDPSRARSGIRASEPPRTSSVAKGAATAQASQTQASASASASSAYDRVEAPRGDPGRGSEARGYEPVAQRTAYDQADGAQTTRVAHQDVYDREDDRSASAHPSGERSPASARTAAAGETQSDRDVRLLASRERSDRARARTAPKTTPPKNARPKTLSR